jgi:hypothetical protein
VEVWSMLLSSGKSFLLIGDVLDWLAEHGYAAAPSGAPASTLAGLADNAVSSIVRLAEELRSGHQLRVAGSIDASDELRAASLAGLSASGLASSPDALRSAIGLASVADWLGQLETLLRDLEKPVAATLTVNVRPWWR